MPLLATDCETIAFCSSSGHCQLDCSYCVVNPVIKRNPSLTYEDVAFFLGAVGTSTFLIFSGKGDFFAGYSKHDRFLGRLLEHDVEVALDVNGLLLQDYPELPAAARRKVRYVNLTMHYAQLLRKRAEATWAENARTLLRLHEGTLNLNTILSPLERETWEESLLFFEREVFGPTGRKLTLVSDCDRAFSAEERAEHDRLSERFAPMIEEAYRSDFEGAFTGRGAVLCPAGKSYFRIWNDGAVEGCPWIAELGGLGNLKERTFAPRSSPFRCTTPRFCDCYDILQLGRMGFEEPAGAALPLHPGPLAVTG
jgi:MoaA/NifB/PqqE/SkfB family radical SAM enzyme